MDVPARISDIHNRGASVLLVEQCVPEVFDLADRLYLMEEGQVVFEGDREQAYREERPRETLLGA